MPRALVYLLYASPKILAGKTITAMKHRCSIVITKIGQIIFRSKPNAAIPWIPKLSRKQTRKKIGSDTFFSVLIRVSTMIVIRPNHKISGINMFHQLGLINRLIMLNPVNMNVPSRIEKKLAAKRTIQSGNKLAGNQATVRSEAITIILIRRRRPTMLVKN